MKVYCNASKRDGEDRPTREPSTEWAGEGYCKATAGRGTDHVGQGRCKHHAGATPIKSGRYSVIERESIRELADHFEDEDDPLDILPELAQMRALLTDFISRYDELREALIRWNANTEEHERPQPIPDLSNAIHYLEKTSKIAQKEKKLQLDDAISRKDLLRVLTEMARSVEHRVDDDDTIQQIKDDWASIRLA